MGGTRLGLGILGLALGLSTGCSSASGGNDGGDAGTNDAASSDSGSLEAATEAGVCAPGATQCSGNAAQTCGAGAQWGSPVACVDQTCIAGACAGVCAPAQTNQVGCGGNCGMDIQTCSATGSWTDGACVQGACAPDATQSCNTYGTQTCDASCAWGACSCPSASVCTPAATECSGSGNAAETCDACGQWESVPCVDQTCVSAVCTGVCAPAQTNPLACGGNCGVDTQTCTATGTWLDGTCVQGACAPNATQTCDTYGTQICQATCAWGACSCPLAPVCTPAATQCSGNAAQTCTTCGQWVGGACANQTCLTPGVCTGVCAPTQTDPVACGNCGTDTQTCTAAGAWQTSGTCANQGVCAPAATQACNTYGTQTCTAGCAWGACSCPPTPVCTPGAAKCTSGITGETCNSCGQWVIATCTTAEQCVAGACLPITSCAAGGVGLTNCGSGSESCCTSLEVPGGMYDRTYNNPGTGATGEADLATVSGFRLDKYEVTVGRFRQYVSYLTGSGGAPPVDGSGKHAYLNGGSGLTNSGSGGGFEGGWDAADWNTNIPTGPSAVSTWNANLGGLYATWPGGNDNRPINYMGWYAAYAFCIWDGGFLPSETEWEYAAAGGSQQREYPWGSTAPGTGSQYAIYGCYYNGTGTCTGVTNIAPVGTATLGVGVWGQLDLGGNLAEWNLDYSGPAAVPYVDPCTDCANLATNTYRIIRGGEYLSDTQTTTHLILAATRFSDFPNTTNTGGIRCARTP